MNDEYCPGALTQIKLTDPLGMMRRLDAGPPVQMLYPQLDRSRTPGKRNSEAI